MRLSYKPFTGMMLVVCVACNAFATPPSPALRDRLDVTLQRELETTLGRLGLIQAISNKQLSVALVDMTHFAHPRVAAVNRDQMFYAASLPKIAILLGAFVLIEQGEMTLDPKTHALLTRMIRQSSNAAATTILHRIGKPNLAMILQSDRFRLYDGV